MSLSQEQQALVALRRMRAKLEALERQRTEPIAVVGLACRFPGAPGLAAFWRLLRDGVDAVSEVPPDRWDVDAFYDADVEAVGKMHTRHGGFVRDLDQFDPQFFGIAPREAVKMDPQHRLLLEVSWEALEHAGQAPDRLAGSRTGVFVGLSSNDYAQIVRQADATDLDAYNLTGNALNFAAGRVSYLLGLQGPSLTVDTACSSSLVAVHLAVQSLRSGECRMALAGGANAILVPDHNVLLSKARMLAPDGRCKTFDAAADGYVRGEGCGVAVLKRLSDAAADGDRVLAIIRGTAVNQDGRSSGLTVPNGPAQEALIREALESARIDPLQVAYVEAHGSGTSLGDPIEVRALNASLCRGRAADRRLLVGSVKTNIGHLEAAAGIAGLIKTVLAIQHGEIPAHLHVREPNPHIAWDELPVAVCGSLTPWPAAYERRVAGVSSFGASGTNAHVLVEQPPDTAAPGERLPERPVHVMTLSARSGDALREAASRWSRALRERSGAPVADAAFTANAGRAHFACRLAFTAASTDEAAARLEALAAGQAPDDVATGVVDPAARPKVAFLFTGQGAQYAGMGRELYDAQPVFRRAFDRCAGLIGPVLGRSLPDALYAGTPPGIVDETGCAQPALFAIEFALTELLASWGVTPATVLGHSIGAYAAACAAGALTVEDAARLVAARGRLMQALPAGGGMAAVFTGEAEVRDAIAPFSSELSLAAVNGAASLVISGARAALDAVVERLRSAGVRTEPLRVSHAFHSPLMDPIRREFEQAASGIAFRAPRIAFVSDLTGQLLESGELSAGYWSRHLREPVRFAAALETAYERGCRLFVEIGPAPILTALARRHLPEDAVCVATMRRARGDWQPLLECLRDLYVHGVDVDWAAFDRGYGRRKIEAPTYPFERRRYWVDAAPGAGSALPASAAGDAGRLQPWQRWLYDLEWRSQPQSGGPRAPLGVASARSIGAAAAADVAHLAEAHNLERYFALQPRIDALCSAYVVRAFNDLGWDLRGEPSVDADALAARARVLDGHRRLFARLFEILEADGVLRQADGSWTVVRPPAAVDAEALSRELLQAYSEYAGEIALVARCGAQLGAVLRGDANPMELLFPQGSLDQLERVYQDAPGSRVFNGLIRKSLEAALAQVPKRRALRVLEIGAGTGSTAAYLLPALDPRRTTYTFTDVSSAFLVRAREKFRQYPFVEYRLLDISQGPAAQGFEPGGFDVIVASHVLHATPDLRRTLANVRALLAPGGVLVLLESTAARRFLDLTFGMTDGWWNFTDRDVRPASALVDAATWCGLLAASGFPDVEVVGDVVLGRASGAAVIVARAGEAEAPVAAPQPGPWLIFADDAGAGEALAALVRARGGRCELVTKAAVDPLNGEGIRRVVAGALADGALRGVVHLWGLDETFSAGASLEEIDAAEQRACGSVLHAVQALVASGTAPAPALTIVTRGAQQAAPGARPVEPAGAMAWGLGRVIAREHPEVRCACIDIDPAQGAADADTIEALYAELMAPERTEDQIAFRGGERFVLRLVPSAAASAPIEAGALELSGDAGYLITGGLAGVGLLVAEHLVSRGARRLVLMGRSAPGEDARKAIERMERSGAAVDVVQASVANRDALADVLRRLDRAGTPLRGIVHSAGALDDGVLAHQTWARFQSVMEAKVHGAWNLHAISERLPLDFFVLFSTSAAILGPAGQANHAAANAFLDALAHHRRARGLPAVSINWGPWSQLGAAARRGVVDRGETQGLGAIDPASGLRMFEHVLRSGASQAAVLPADWPRMIAASSAWNMPLLREVAGTPAARETRVEPVAPPAPAGPTFRQQLEEAPPLRRWPLLLSHVAEVAGRVLGVAPAELDARQGLRDLGLDSLMALELRNRLQRSVDRPLRSTLAFDYPTIDAIARHLADDVLALEREAREAETEPAPSADAADLLLEIERLSDDDVDRLIASKATLGT